MKVYVSPSHQNNNAYAYGNTTEMNVCRDIARKLTDKLITRGVEVMLGTNTPSQNASDSNKWGADVHICVHTNAGGGDGSLVLCHSKSVNDERVKRVYKALADLTPTNDDGIRIRDDIPEIYQTKAVCIYCECEFHDTPALAKWIIEHEDDIAQAICDGLLGETTTDDVSTSENVSRETLYTVQVGAFKVKDNAEKLLKALKSAGYQAYVTTKGGE